MKFGRQYIEQVVDGKVPQGRVIFTEEEEEGEGVLSPGGIAQLLEDGGIDNKAKDEPTDVDTIMRDRPGFELDDYGEVRRSIRRKNLKKISPPRKSRIRLRKRSY